MKTILVVGASGFIGGRLVSALKERGCRVIAVSRHGSDIQGDFTTDVRPEDWIPRLRGVDVVINAVGIIRERGAQTFRRLHVDGPTALFRACVAVGVQRVVQISALGAESGSTPYFLSKREADEFLMTLPLDGCVVRPSLVYGPNGGSARLFDLLASLPWIPLPQAGSSLIQPVHIDDLIAALVQVATEDKPIHRVIPVVGPRAIPLAEFLTSLRGAMGLAPTRVVQVPQVLMRIGAALGDVIKSPVLGRDTLAMLAAGNTGDVEPIRQLLGRAPRDVDAFIERESAAALRTAAQLRWLLPLLRFSVALVWLWTAAVSLGIYPVAASYELLARTGLTGWPASIALYGAALLDLTLGIATLTWHRRRLLWLLQLTLIAAYSIIIALRLPEFWLHPYGPLVKNIPLLAAIFLLYVLEPERWNT